jgi:SSS family solute:Na+ symporter
VDPKTLKTFFKTVRPFGLWKPIKKQAHASGELSLRAHEKPGRIILNVILGMIAILGLYLAPMYLVGHWFSYAAICLGTALLATAVLYITWYRPIIRTKQEF